MTEKINRNSKGQFIKGHKKLTNKGDFKKGHKIRIGMKHSEKSKQLMSENNGMHKLENRIKVSKTNKGKHFSPETEFKKGENMGKNNPNWQGGIMSESYDKIFNNKFKRAVRKRDNQICMLCGIHKEKLKKSLDVHHVNYDKKLSIFQNCISLCPSCHIKTGFNREHWLQFFQSLLSEKYGYNYAENNQIIMELKI